MNPRRLAARLALTGLVGVFVFAGISAFFVWQFTSPHRRVVGAAPREFISDCETVEFSARDGVKLAGWFVP